MGKIRGGCKTLRNWVSASGRSLAGSKRNAHAVGAIGGSTPSRVGGLSPRRRRFGIAARGCRLCSSLLRTRRARPVRAQTLASGARDRDAASAIGTEAALTNQRTDTTLLAAHRIPRIFGCRRYVELHARVSVEVSMAFCEDAFQRPSIELTWQPTRRVISAALGVSGSAAT